MEMIRTQEGWKRKNLDDAIVYAEQWRELITTAVNVQSRLIAENFYKQSLEEIKRIESLDYSKFENIPYYG
jgi:hypothetical protein